MRYSPPNNNGFLAFKFIITVLFFILPFMAVIKYRFPIINIGGLSLAGSIKDALMLCFIGFSLLNIILNRIKLDAYALIIIFYLTWVFLRSVFSLAPLTESLNFLRFEMFSLLFFTLLYIQSKHYHFNFLKLHTSLTKIFFFQFLTIVTIGWVEIFDKKIRFFLYAEKANNLVTGFPGVEEVRLVSTLENPINLGVFICLGVGFISYYLLKTNRPFLLLMTVLYALPVLFLTFSRTAIGIYLIILMLIVLPITFLKSTRLKKVMLVCCFTLVSISIISYVASDDKLRSVIEKRFDQKQGSATNSISHDPRFQNWTNAYSYLNNQSLFFTLVGGGVGLSNPAGEIGTYKIENSYITVIYQTGFIGGGIYFFIIYCMFRACWKAKRLYGSDLALSTIIFTVAYVLAAMTSDLHRNNPFSFYFGYMIFLCLNICSGCLVNEKNISANA